MGNRWGNSGNSVRLYLWGLQKSLHMVIETMKLKDIYSLEGSRVTIYSLDVLLLLFGTRVLGKTYQWFGLVLGDFTN